MKSLKRCKICGQPFEGEKDICPNRSCRDEIIKRQQRQVEAKRKRKRWQEKRSLRCIVPECGKVLKHPGQYCREHKYLYKREWRRRRKDNVQSQE